MLAWTPRTLYLPRRHTRVPSWAVVRPKGWAGHEQNGNGQPRSRPLAKGADSGASGTNGKVSGSSAVGSNTARGPMALDTVSSHSLLRKAPAKLFTLELPTMMR